MRTMALLGLMVMLTGADWPQFRGPTQMGVSESKRLPVEWSPGNNITWKVPVPGKGWSSPVIAGGTIVITTAVEDDDHVSLRVLAYDAKTGQLRWNRELLKRAAKDIPKNHSKNSYASPSCVIDGSAVYAHFGHLGTAKLAMTDGAVVWFNTDLAYKPVHGNGGSPLLVDGRLVFNIDGADRQEVVALDVATGKVAWRTPRKTKPGRPFSFGTCTLVTMHGKPQIISPGSDVVMALDPSDGKEIWRFAYTGYSVVTRPVVAEGIVYCCTSYDNSKLIAVRPSAAGGDQTADGLVWKAEKNAPHNPSLIVDQGLVYGVSDAGVASCWDAKTGEVLWSERVPDKYSSSLLIANGKLYLQAENGVAMVLKTGRTFEIVARNDFKERTLSSYGVVDDALIVRTEKHLYRIEEAK